MPATDKSTKPTANPKTTGSTAGPKIFDISKPGKTNATATSRPLIVSNRPVMQDPMMSKPASPDATATPSADAEISNAVSPSHTTLTIKPFTDDGEGADTEAVKDAVKPEEGKKIAATAVPEASKDAADTKSKAKEPAPATEPEPVSPAVDADAEAAPGEPVPVNNSVDEVTATPLPGSEGPDADTETTALELAAKHEEEVTKLVDSHQYFLPINSIERRRSKIVTLLGVVLILALGVLLVDLLLDAGYLRINGVKPFTHFFSS